MRTIVGLSICLTLLTASAGAQQSTSGGAPLQVEQPWARASNGTTGAAYLRIANRGSAPDRLVGASTPVAEKAEVHENKIENGVMKMRSVGSIVIGPGQSAVLKPGAEHVMLMGLKQPLKQGESFPLTLKFEKAGDVQVTVHVERAGAMGADAAGHGPMQHMHEGGMDHGGMK